MAGALLLGGAPSPATAGPGSRGSLPSGCSRHTEVFNGFLPTTAAPVPGVNSGLLVEAGFFSPTPGRRRDCEAAVQPRRPAAGTFRPVPPGSTKRTSPGGTGLSSRNYKPKG